MAVTLAEQATGAVDTTPAITHGAIVELAAPVDAAGGPRVCVVVQADLFNETHATVTLCPLTAVVGVSKNVPNSRCISFWSDATSRSGSQRTNAM